MAGDASHVLGAREVAGTLVNPKGLTKKMTARAAGQVVGGAAGAMAVGLKTGDAYAGAPEVPEFGRVGYVAVSDSELALVKTKTGLMRMKVGDEVLARVPRSEIASAELDQGKMLSHLTIAFVNGVEWEFDVPKMGRKTAQGLVRALGGKLS